MVVARPSARIARAMSSPWICFFTISPVAKTSPVVSTAVMIMTMIIDTIAASLNVGVPKWNGVVTPKRSASPTPAEVGEVEQRCRPRCRRSGR